jgi:hypothetical protein
MLSLLPLLFSATMAASGNASSTYALLDSPTRHVRTTDRNVERLLRTGVARSPTFASLMSHLNGTDVIVYVEAVPTLPTTLAGRLLLMPFANHQRYLRIQIAFAGTQNELIALIGHELRHAVEVADATNVRTESELVTLYKRIGNRTRDLHSYETNAAQTTASVVRRELAA